MSIDEQLAKENFQIINLIDAMRGCVTAGMRAIVLSVENSRIEIAFVLYEDSENTREEIEEIEVNFSGYEGTKLPVSIKVVVDVDSLVEELGLTGRVVLLRRE